MTFGQILDRIFRLVRSQLRPLLAIGAFPICVVVVFEAMFFGSLYLAGAFHRPLAQPQVAAMLWIFLPAGLLFVAAMFVMYGIYYGASAYAAVQADLNLKVTAAEALRHAWSKLGRYIWLYLLRSLIVVIPILVIALAAALGGIMLGILPRANDPNPAALFFLIPLFVLFYLGAFIYAVLMSLRLSLAFPACVHENLTAMQAIKRSGVLTNGAKGRIFLVLLVIYAISYAAAMMLYVVGLFVFAIAAVAGAGHASLTSPVTIALAVIGGLVLLALVLLWSAALMAAYSCAFAVLYRDQCLRKQRPPMPSPIAGPA
jgi:hypothetical protein